MLPEVRVSSVCVEVGLGVGPDLLQQSPAVGSASLLCTKRFRPIEKISIVLQPGFSFLFLFHHG